MKGQKQLFSSNSDEYSTPQKLFDELNKEFKFTLDPCATKKNAKCKKFYTKKEDGLKQDWKGETVFVNPPYSKIKDWIHKCFNEILKPKTTCVMLIPARTCTSWFHNFMWNKTVHEPYVGVKIRFLKGRLTFEDDKGNPVKTWSKKEKKWKVSPAPFPSMIVVFRS